MPDAEVAKSTKPSAGASRAAAVLLGLGPEAAADVFKLLTEAEVRTIAAGARQLRSGRPEALVEALQSFVDEMAGVRGELATSDHMLRAAAEQALERRSG